MQGSSSATDTDASAKAEAIFGYNSSTAKKARLQSMLAALLSDPVLSDVPKKPTIADVDTLISLELGSAMKLSIVKMDNTSFDVAVLNSATVKDLKLAIKKKTEEMQQGRMGHRHISWCSLYPVLCHDCPRSTLGEENIVSFMALASSGPNQQPAIASSNYHMSLILVYVGLAFPHHDWR